MGYVLRHKGIIMTYFVHVNTLRLPYNNHRSSKERCAPDIPLRYRILRLCFAPLQVKSGSRGGEPLRSVDSRNPHGYAYFRLILRVHVSDPLRIELYPDAYPDCQVVLATFTGAGGGSH